MGVGDPAITTPPQQRALSQLGRVVEHAQSALDWARKAKYGLEGRDWPAPASWKACSPTFPPSQNDLSSLLKVAVSRMGSSGQRTRRVVPGRRQRASDASKSHLSLVCYGGTFATVIRAFSCARPGDVNEYGLSGGTRDVVDPVLCVPVVAEGRAESVGADRDSVAAIADRDRRVVAGALGTV